MYSPQMTRRAPSSINSSFDSPKKEDSLVFKEQQLKWLRSAEMNLKSCLFQTTIAVLCFVEFYLRPFDLFISQRKLGSFYVWLLGVLFASSAFICFLCYLVYRNKHRVSLLCRRKLFTLHQNSPIDNFKRKLLLSSNSIRENMSNSFNCVRLSNSQNNSHLANLDDSQNSLFAKFSAGPLNLSAASSIFNNSPGKLNHSLNNSASFSRSRLSPNNSMNATGNSSCIRGQGRNSSFSVRQRSSLIAAAEQSFHLSPMTCLSSSTSPRRTGADFSFSSVGTVGDDRISDVRDLEKYLNSFYQQEAETLAALDGARFLNDASPSSRLLRNLPNDKYQISSPSLEGLDPKSTSPLAKSSAAASLASIVKSDIVYFGGMTGLDVGDKIQNWVENLRKWIAATVLKPLVKGFVVRKLHN